MADDSYTEITRTSWGSRIGGSLKGILFGLIVFFAAFPLLFWNEGRTVETYKSLVEGAGLVKTVPVTTVDSANNGQLVHLTGLAITEETLSDTELAVSANAIKLRRVVEMYQWNEHSKSEIEKNVGGSTETRTTYSYSKEWSSILRNSSNFKNSSTHTNPLSMPYQSFTRQAQNVSLGVFKLSAAQISEIANYSSLDVAPFGVPDSAGAKAKIYQQGFYLGSNPSYPEIGDVKIHYEVVLPTQISLIAAQINNTFTSYQTEAGGEIDILQTGVHTAAAMFKDAQSTNALISWGLRALGLLLMFIGLSMVMKPLSVLADVLPFVGNIVGAGTGLVAFLIALVLSILTIAIAWIFYRPLLAGGLIAVAIALFVFARKKIKSAASRIPASAPSSATPPPPPPHPPAA